jgi:hypothetical protein
MKLGAGLKWGVFNKKCLYWKKGGRGSLEGETFLRVNGLQKFNEITK